MARHSALDGVYRYVMTRRLLIAAAGFGVAPASAAKNEQVYRFRTSGLDIEMTIQFHDGYSSRGFWFRERMSGRDYCLSGNAEEGRDCLKNFRGSLALAQYRVRPHTKQEPVPPLREYVRMIDHDARLDGRPPFERVIKLHKGIGTDLQAFGYEAAPNEKPISELHGPWYLFRQDLFLEPQRAPFLVVYWKHKLTSIRILDVIPGDQTWVVKK